jgi:hypothetical protein
MHDARCTVHDARCAMHDDVVVAGRVDVTAQLWSRLCRGCASVQLGLRTRLWLRTRLCTSRDQPGLSPHRNTWRLIWEKPWISPNLTVRAPLHYLHALHAQMLRYMMAY